MSKTLFVGKYEEFSVQIHENGEITFSDGCRVYKQSHGDDQYMRLFMELEGYATELLCTVPYGGSTTTTRFMLISLLEELSSLSY